MHFLIDLLRGIVVPHITTQKDGRGGKGRTDVIDGGNRSMKLIIDIPEVEYKRMTEESIFSTNAMITAIQNGIPLDDVKAEIQDLYVGYRHGYEIKADVLQILDNIGKAESEIHCDCTDEEIAKSFIEDVETVKDLLPRAESEDKE